MVGDAGDPALEAATEAPPQLVLLVVGGVGALAGEMAGLPAVVAPATAAATIAAAISTLLAVPGEVPLLAALEAATTPATAAATAISTSSVPAAAASSAVTSTTSSVPAASAAVAACSTAAPTGTRTAGERAATGRGDVEGLGAAVVARSDGELDGVALVEAAEALGLDGGLVHEDVLAAGVWGDEAEPLGGVEPLDGPLLPLRRHLGRRT